MELKSWTRGCHLELFTLRGMLALATAAALWAQPAFPADGPPGDGGGPGDAFLGGGPPSREKRELVRQFDQNNDQWLNAVERKAAREFLKANPAPRRGPGGPGGSNPPFRPGRAEDSEPAKPGPKVAVRDAKAFPGVPFYDANTVRTLFLEFENADCRRSWPTSTTRMWRCRRG